MFPVPASQIQTGFVFSSPSRLTRSEFAAFVTVTYNQVFGDLVSHLLKKKLCEVCQGPF